MPIEHIVLLQWKPELSPAQVQRQTDLATGLRGQIPGMIELEAGRPFRQAPDDAAWDYALLMLFARREDLAAWATAPEHDAFNAAFLPGVAKYLVVDFER
jgi:hypothetical protein